MKYNNITQATFINRPNRFIAEVDINGRREIVHVKNTGRCKELLIPGCEVWLTEPGTPGRKTRYDLVAVRKDNGILFNIDSQAPNKVVKEWLAGQGYSKVVPEYTYGKSRIDFYMEKAPDNLHEGSEPKQIYMENVARKPKQERSSVDLANEESGQERSRVDLVNEESRQERSSVISMDEESEPERFLMEVMGCTLEVDGIGYFPDAPTERGVKHIRELIGAGKAGYHAILAFVIQMDGVCEVRPNIATHPEFGVAMDEAREAGVEILFLTCHVEPDEIVITL